VGPFTPYLFFEDIETLRSEGVELSVWGSLSLFLCLYIQAPFVCWKVVSFWKVNSGKVNFSMFGSVMKNKLENTFQCLVMSWKMSWKITY
jgi:hypothetical protein